MDYMQFFSHLSLFGIWKWGSENLDLLGFGMEFMGNFNYWGKIILPLWFPLLFNMGNENFFSQRKEMLQGHCSIYSFAMGFLLLNLSAVQLIEVYIAGIYL